MRRCFAPQSHRVTEKFRNGDRRSHRCIAIGLPSPEQALARIQLDFPSQRAGTPQDKAQVIGLSEQWQALRAEGRFAEALAAADQACRLYAQTQPERGDQMRILLNNLAIAQLDAQAPQDAEATCVQALTGLGPASEITANVAITHNLLAQAQHRRGDHAGAIDNLQMAIAIRSSIEGRATPAVANLLVYLGDAQAARGDTDAAGDSYREAMDILAGAAGSHGLAQVVAARYADHLLQHGPADEAEAACRKAAEMASRGVPPGDAGAVHARMRLAEFLHRAGRRDEAQDICDALLAALPPGESADPVRLEVLHRSGSSLLQQDRYADARKVTAQLVALQRRMGLTGAQCDDALWGHALASHGAGDFAAAVEAGQALLASPSLSEKTRIETHRLLASAWRELHELAAALPHLRAVAEHERSACGESSAAHALALHKLGGALHQLDKLDEAQGTFHRALAAARVAYGEESDEVANIVNAVGVVASERSDFESAKASLKEALAINEKLYGPGQAPVIAQNLARVLAALGEKEEAGAVLERSLEAARAEAGGSSLVHVNHLITLGEVRWRTGACEEAEALLADALERGNALWHPFDPIRNKALCILGMVRAEMGHHRNALDTFLEAEALQLRSLMQTLGTASEAERLGSLRRLRLGTEFVLSLVCTQLSHDPESVRAAWRLHLRRKTLGMDVLALQRAIAHRSDDPSVRMLASELIDLRRQLAAAELTGPRLREDGEVDFEPYAATTLSLKARIGAHEERIAAELLKDPALVAMTSTGVHQVLEAIPQRSVLIDFARVRCTGFGHDDPLPELLPADARYIAFLAAAGADAAGLVDLGPAERIDGLIEQLQHAMFGKPPAEADDAAPAAAPAAEGAVEDDPAGALSALLLLPLLAAVPAGTKRWFIMPDGELSRPSARWWIPMAFRCSSSATSASCRPAGTCCGPTARGRSPGRRSWWPARTTS
jgi:tetratricopeptide (TPR) repeat protein